MSVFKDFSGLENLGKNSARALNNKTLKVWQAPYETSNK